MTPSTQTNRFAHLEAADIIRASAIAELLAGIWLYFSPWIYQVTSGTAFNGWVLGPLIAVAAAFQLGCPGRDTAELTGLVNCLLGIWVFVSPWTLRYSADTGRLVNSLCVGAIVFIAAVITLIAARWGATHPSHGDHLVARHI